MRYWFGVICLAVVSGTTSAQDPNDELAKQAKQILTTHCYRCHGQNDSAEGGMDYILNFDELKQYKKVIPGDAEKSRLYKRINPDLVGGMPDDSLTKPTAAEIETIKKWIVAGAPSPKDEVAKPRPFLGLQDELVAIDKYLFKQNQKRWPYLRFFTLRNLYNRPTDQVRDEDLRLYQAALSKLLNSLSWKEQIVVPEKVDAAGMVLAIDTRDLDWADEKGRDLWREILKRYPYALKHDRYPDVQEVNNLWTSITDKTKAVVPVVRADWFIANASRPPLYHTLVQLPENLNDLLKRIPSGDRKVLDLNYNFIQQRVARAGFNGSGVSERNNRLIERHETSYGAFWISYDFKVSAGKGNLFVFPLGPSFKENPYEKFAFRHDGGEIIFNLPNHMQAYLLINAKGQRIDEGPIEIVSDGKKVSGTPAIVNGLSCMSCHQHGMIHKEDQIRETAIQLGGKARDAVKEIYLTHADMEKKFVADEKRFLEALDNCIGPFLKVDKNKDKNIKDFAEPVAPIAKWYIAVELDLAEAARDLGLEKPGELESKIDGNEELQQQGLLPLTKKKKIKREVWESTEFLESAYQKSAKVLKIGEPVTVR